MNQDFDPPCYVTVSQPLLEITQNIRISVIRRALHLSTIKAAVLRDVAQALLSFLR